MTGETGRFVRLDNRSCRDVVRTALPREGKSRNKVTVGEPSVGSRPVVTTTINRWRDSLYVRFSSSEKRTAGEANLSFYPHNTFWDAGKYKGTERFAAIEAILNVRVQSKHNLWRWITRLARR